MKRMWLYIVGSLLLSLLLLSGCVGPQAVAPEETTLALEPCQLAMPGMNGRLPAQCGTLRVYEDPLAQAGRQIDLFVAQRPARSRTAEPDPVFFVTGGPGGASTQDYVSLADAFHRIHLDRDIVMVDQRGTGKSHPLSCPALAEDADASDEAVIAAWAEDCLAELDADPALYTTEQAVQDLDQVRAALGYEQINLYGVSYGTRVVQAYMRAYPEHVRTVILDGVVPQDEPLGLKISSDAQQALDRIFARCAADVDCNTAFPDLAAAFDALLAQLEAQPVSVSVAHPTSGELTQVDFDRDSFASTVRLFSYTPETVALMPLLIYSTYTSGDFSHMAAQSLLIGQQLEGNMNRGMHDSVVCSEDVPFYFDGETFAGDADLQRAGYLREFYLGLQDMCVNWPTTPVDAEFKTLVTSDLPVLLLSGEFDPVTPPENAERVAANLPNSLHLVAPGQGHNVVLRGCLPRLVRDFVVAGSADDLNGACVDDIAPLPFFLSFSGSTP